jgi:hypothetical protein
MTQRIFDIENKKDMADLWDILPEEIEKIKKAKNSYELDVLYVKDGGLFSSLFKINWHDKTEITRPIQEATEADIGKLCYFGDVKPNKKIVGLLGCIDSESIYNKYMMRGGSWFEHCQRLTKQEIEELC